jgi:hypothetical protein
MNDSVCGVQNHSQIIQHNFVPAKFFISQKVVGAYKQLLNLEPYFEPIFACAYFIDLQTKSRLTENFYFDFNTREMLGLIRVHLGIDEQPFHIREALLNAEHFGSNVFLIIRMEKILQASDCSDAIEPYIAKDKTQEKLIYNARVFCERLGAYRMPIGWNFIELKTLLQGPQRG